MARNVGASPDREIKATRREFLRGAPTLAASAATLSAYNDAIADPIIALIGEERRWRALGVAARARAEMVLFALPRNEWPTEFDDHPIMTAALSLETRADQVYARIIETPARTLIGIVAKLEWAEGDAEVAETVIADLRRWLTAQQ